MEEGEVVMENEILKLNIYLKVRKKPLLDVREFEIFYISI